MLVVLRVAPPGSKSNTSPLTKVFIVAFVNVIVVFPVKVWTLVPLDIDGPITVSPTSIVPNLGANVNVVTPEAYGPLVIKPSAVFNEKSNFSLAATL